MHSKCHRLRWVLCWKITAWLKPTHRFDFFSIPLVALLSGARNDKNTQLAQNICDRLKRLFPSTKDSIAAAEVLLANTYASSGDIGKASNIRIQLTKSGAKKKIGTSTTVVDGEIYVSSNTACAVFFESIWTDLIVGISSSWQISSSITRNLSWSGENIERINRTWPWIWLELDNTNDGWRWKRRIGSLWS